MAIENNACNAFCNEQKHFSKEIYIDFEDIDDDVPAEQTDASSTYIE